MFSEQEILDILSKENLTIEKITQNINCDINKKLKTKLPAIQNAIELYFQWSYDQLNEESEIDTKELSEMIVKFIQENDIFYCYPHYIQEGYI